MFLPRGAAEIDFSLERQRVQAACPGGVCAACTALRLVRFGARGKVKVRVRVRVSGQNQG